MSYFATFRLFKFKFRLFFLYLFLLKSILIIFRVNKKKTYRKTAKLFTSDSSDDCVIEGNSIEEDVQDDKTESDIEKTPPNKNR